MKKSENLFADDALKIRISIKNLNTGENYKLTLDQMPGGYKRFRLLLNGKLSKKHPVITLSDLFAIIRQWVGKWEPVKQ